MADLTKPANETAPRTHHHRPSRDGLTARLKRAGKHAIRDSKPSQWLLSERRREQLLARARLGYWPHVRQPETFNEKILHRKLFTNDERFGRLEDKVAAREYVAAKGKGAILPEQYHVTSDPRDIPFEELPERFVVKAAHGSGMNSFVEEKSTVDREQVMTRCAAWLERDFGAETNEYWYSAIEPRLIIEEFLPDSRYPVPPDLKCLVFDGEVVFVEALLDRFGNTTNRLYDPSWTPLAVRYDFPLGPLVDRPEQLEEMIHTAEILGEGFDFVRVDFLYPNRDRIVFGEFTFAPASGRGVFDPPSFDAELGTYW